MSPVCGIFLFHLSHKFHDFFWEKLREKVSYRLMVSSPNLDFNCEICKNFIFDITSHLELIMLFLPPFIFFFFFFLCAMADG